MRALEGFGVVNKKLVRKKVDCNITPHTRILPSDDLDLKTRLLFKRVSAAGHEAVIMKCAIGDEFDIPFDEVLPQKILVIAA